MIESGRFQWGMRARGLLALAFLLAGHLSWAEWEFARTVNPMDGAEREFFVLDGVPLCKKVRPKP